VVVVGLLLSRSAGAQSSPAAPETIAVGDWQLAPTLQLRTRGEYWRDPIAVGGGPITEGGGARVRDAWLVFERSRVGLGAERGPLRAQVTLQDTRGWGDGGGNPLALTPLFAPFEAFAEIRSSAARPSFLRIGRQAVEWGEGNLVGVADWSPYARSLDAARGHVATGNFDFEALAAILDASSPSPYHFGPSAAGSSSGTQIYGVSAGWSVDPALKVEVFALARVAREAGVGPSRFATAALRGETYTAEIRASGDAKGLRYAVEGAYQLGDASALAPGGVTRAAYAGAAHVARTFDGLVLTPTLRVGASYASGDSGGGKYTQFDPLLPDVHVRYGAMDAFAWSNVADVNGRVTLVPWTDTLVTIEYRYARLADAGGEWLNGYLFTVGRAPGNASADLGQEIDAGFSWQPWAPLDLRAGYSGLLLGDGARTILAGQARGAPQPNGTFAPAAVAHFTYLQATLAVP